MEIKLIPNRYPEIGTSVTLKTPVSSLCPQSREPQEGSFVSVKYIPKESLIDIHAVEKYMKELSEGSDPLDLETTTHLVLLSCSKVVEVIEVEAYYKLRNGLEITCKCRS